MLPATASLCLIAMDLNGLPSVPLGSGCSSRAAVQVTGPFIVIASPRSIRVVPSVRSIHRRSRYSSNRTEAIAEMLSMVPCSGGGILPCLAFVAKVSLAGRGANPIPLRSPFTRRSGTPRVPLLLGATDDVTWFTSDDPAALSSGRLSDGISYQTIWMASPGAVVIAMRMMADDECRPVQ